MTKNRETEISTVLPTGDYPIGVGTDAYYSFLKNCIQRDQAYDEGSLNVSGGEFSTHSRRIQAEINRFKATAHQYPLMAIIFLWAQWISNDIVLGEKYLSMMEELVNTGLLPHKNSNNHPINIVEFANIHPAFVVDEIRRCNRWSIDRREDFVRFYCEFSKWLSKHTFGLVPVAFDHDREVTRQRKLSFDIYIKFLTHLELRERIMTKIFYLGGSIALEDVLSLKIENIEFENSSICLGANSIRYSLHVLEDLRLFITVKSPGRTQGYVFTGRQSERINHTIPYRALKMVASKLGMGSDFTFKEFIKNH